MNLCLSLLETLCHVAGTEQNILSAEDPVSQTYLLDTQSYSLQRSNSSSTIQDRLEGERKQQRYQAKGYFNALFFHPM